MHFAGVFLHAKLQQARPVIGNALALNIGNAYHWPMNSVQRAIDHLGSQSALAEKLGVTQPTVSEWRRGERPVPVDRAPEIERGTDGTVPCEETRPDITWHRVPDKSWPWHPKGRPLVDVTRTAEAA